MSKVTELHPSRLPKAPTVNVTPSYLLGPDVKEGPAACELLSYNQAVSGYKKAMAICGDLPSKNPLFLALMPVVWAMHDRAKATAPSERKFYRDMGYSVDRLFDRFKNE
jgi:hypothetical protein